ncbi:hypothetical protein LguiA_004970 [Lonicera macranthoides]
MGVLKTKKVGVRVTYCGIKANISTGNSATTATTSDAKCKVDLMLKIWKWTGLSREKNLPATGIPRQQFHVVSQANHILPRRLLSPSLRHVTLLSLFLSLARSITTAGHSSGELPPAAHSTINPRRPLRWCRRTAGGVDGGRRRGRRRSEQPEAIHRRSDRRW